MFCLGCHEPIPKARLKAIPNATLCVECMMGIGDVLPLRCMSDHTGEEQTDTLFTSNSMFEEQIKRERTYPIAAKVMSECTEAEPVKAKSTEIKADERGNNTMFSILSGLEESNDEEKE
jgi:hypothetical protein